jgi:hypothetical protein
MQVSCFFSSSRTWASRNLSNHVSLSLRGFYTGPRAPAQRAFYDCRASCLGSLVMPKPWFKYDKEERLIENKLRNTSCLTWSKFRYH